MSIILNIEEQKLFADMLDTLAFRANLTTAGFVKDNKVGLYFCTNGLSKTEIQNEIDEIKDFMRLYLSSETEIDDGFLDFLDTETWQVYVTCR